MATHGSMCAAAMAVLTCAATQGLSNQTCITVWNSGAPLCTLESYQDLNLINHLPKLSTEPIEIWHIDPSVANLFKIGTEEKNQKNVFTVCKFTVAISILATRT